MCEVQHGRGCAADDALEEGAKVDLVRIRGRVRVRVRVRGRGRGEGEGRGRVR